MTGWNFGRVVVAGVALVVALVGTGVDADRGIGPEGLDGVDTGYVLDALDLEGLEVSLTVDHADTFAGMSFDDQQRVATVHVRRGSDLGGVERELAAVAAEPFHTTRLQPDTPSNGKQRPGRSAVTGTPRRPYRVILQPEKRSLAQLDAERQRVADSSLGEYIVLDRVVAEQNEIDVTLHALPGKMDARRVPAVAERVADDTAVNVHVDWSIDERPGSFVSRRDDRRPHKAGLQIVGPQGQRCTGGPTVRPKDGAHRTMLTAGHCGRRRSRWEGSNGKFVGFVADRAFGNGYFDSARLRKPNYPKGFAPRMFGGGADSSELHWVRGALSANVGGRVCTSGASFGDQCNGARVRQRNVCVMFTDIDKRTCFLDLADQTGAGPGDSGGPLYRQRRDGRLVIGTIVGGNDDLLVYHPVGRLLNRWDAVLLTR